MPLTGAEIWRDFILDGVPASGVHNVVKGDMRDWMANNEALLASMPPAWGSIQTYTGSVTVSYANNFARTLLVSGTADIAFDAVASLGDTFWCRIVNIGTRRRLLNPSGSELVDGLTTVALWPGQSCIVICSGSALYTLGRPARWRNAPTIYVATTGDDANDGLVSGSPKLLIQTAVDFIVLDCDVAPSTGGVQLADGTYDQRFQVVGDGLGSNQVAVTGNPSSPTSCVISPTSGGDGIVYAKDKGIITLNGLYLWSTTAAAACAAEQLGVLDILNCAFGPMGVGSHLRASNGAGQINVNSSYDVYGGAVAHMDCEFGSRITINNAVVTTHGNMTFTYWALAQWLGGIQIASSSYTAASGSVTAQKFLAQLNGIISKGGSTFPGNVAGTTATGGQVV